ncbi:hypothetical protein FBEOM_6999 [Fusarium beomiforme]|uniref:Uncharacterized protein n=1 Tax=Fusarium beomiforme TaxID=44412 RepID=A0A9P5DY48_9HYPO|nr:hypothetical protein FBEOM_6999 [Fusarium beomiforme]
MTGKPVYKPEEIRFALDLMAQDLYNQDISHTFERQFRRKLTDNQIRYLRNKYGKDPDYGAPLVNMSSGKKLKRCRAAFGAGYFPSPASEYVSNTDRTPSFTYPSNQNPRGSPTEAERAQQDSFNASAGPLQSLGSQIGSLPSQSPVKCEDMRSHGLSSAQLFRAAPQAQMASFPSPPANTYGPSGPLTQRNFAFGPSVNSWETQPRATFNTNFSPITTRFGQYQLKSPDQGSLQVSNPTPYQIPSQPSHTQTSPSNGFSSTHQPTANSPVHLGTPISSPPQTVATGSGA